MPFRYLIVVLYILCLTAPSFTRSEIKLELGKKVPKSLVPEKIDKYIFGNPYQFYPFIEREVDGVDYTIAFLESNRKIVFIRTMDEDFETKSGLRIDSEIEVTRNDLIDNGTWYTLGPKTKDGWFPVLPTFLFDPDSDAKTISLVKSLKPGEKRTLQITSFLKSSFFEDE